MAQSGRNALLRSHGKIDGLNVVDVFSKPYPDEEDAYTEDSDTASDTASLSQMSWDSISQDGNDSILTIESDSSPESKSSTKSWKKSHVNPWKDLKKAKRESQEKSQELTAERRAHRALLTEFADMKGVVAKAEEEKDGYIAWIQRANDERDLAMVTAENEIYQLMERLKESETNRRMLEEKLQQFENESNITKRRPSRGSAIIRGGKDIASRRWRFGRRNPNPAQESAVPLDCIEEQ